MIYMGWVRRDSNPLSLWHRVYSPARLSHVGAHPYTSLATAISGKFANSVGLFGSTSFVHHACPRTSVKGEDASPQRLNATKPCDGSAACEAVRHVHGCFADKGDCDRPGEHADDVQADAVRDQGGNA